MPRISIDISVQEHQQLKDMAALKGLSIKDYVLALIQADISTDQPRMGDDEELVPIFYVKDGRETAAWYARLGFVIEAEHRFAPMLPLYLFLRRGPNAIHLSEHKGDARPNTLVYLYVNNLEEIAAEFVAKIEDQPWARDVEIKDPDGNRLRIGQRKNYMAK